VGLTSQIHDFNPGIAESGLFWTTPIDPSDVHVDLAAGVASLHVRDLDVEDYGNVVNALKDGPSVPASVDLEVAWSGGHRKRVRNADQKFVGEYIRDTATLTWSASEHEFVFRSDPLNSGFAEIGSERNGVFFS
jgi:hypothetical protein